MAGCLYRSHSPTDKRRAKSAPSCLLGRTLWSFLCLPWSCGRAGCPLLQPVGKVKSLRPSRRQQLLKGHFVPPDMANPVRLFIKLLLARLPIKYSCENEAFFFSSRSLWCSLVFLVRGTEELYFLKVQVQAANLANTQRGFGGHLMFLRVLAIEGHIPAGSFWFLTCFGFYVAVGKNKRPFPSLGCKTKELSRKKIINLVEFHELLGLKE